jgi:hypothetical protein
MSISAELTGPQFPAGIEESHDSGPGPIYWSALHTRRGGGQTLQQQLYIKQQQGQGERQLKTRTTDEIGNESIKFQNTRMPYPFGTLSICRVTKCGENQTGSMRAWNMAKRNPQIELIFCIFSRSYFQTSATSKRMVGKGQISLTALI